MYNKLFGKILDSSIWLEDHATIRVWITLLASMDEDGFCQFAAMGNLARRAAVSLEEATSAIDKLEGPDPDSNDPDNEGRRIERVQGGWIVLNAVKYREMVTRQVIKEGNRLRMQQFRAKKGETSKETNSEAGLPEYAESVANAFSITHKGTVKSIMASLDAHVKTHGIGMEETATLMREAYQTYLSYTHLIERPVGPAKFFSQGYWLQNANWRVQKQRL